LVEKLKIKGLRILDIDGVKAFDRDNNWILIRGSNTLPVIKMNAEAKTEERMKELFDFAKKLIKEEIDSYENSNN